MMRAPGYGFALLVVACACVLAFACSSATLNEYCTGIPSGGCPGADGTNCADPTCAVIYSRDITTCAWTFVQACPGYVAPHDAGPSNDATDAAVDASPDVALHDAGFPLPPGANGQGCMDLEPPDCTVEMAVECGKYCCGCQALYVCSDGGWNLWGECDDAGAATPTTAP